VSAAVASGPPVYVSIPAFVEKNFIGRDPLKESVLGCTPDATARLLQLREALASHTHAGLDEILYVVAGEGAVFVQGESTPVAPGSLSVVPRGLQHAIERRGKNPLIVVSTLVGAPCPEAPAAQLSSK
jgi:mannose-6-phosphate isomerase-like protein (cupin superfamily)